MFQSEICIDGFKVYDDFTYCGFVYLIVKRRFLFWTIRSRICLGSVHDEESIWSCWRRCKAFKG
jgi:hypothetical protein